VIPPRATAVLSSELDTPTQRDRHLAMIAEQGRLAWQASRFPRLAHRSASVHKLPSATATSKIAFDSGKGETFSRRPALAYSSQPNDRDHRSLLLSKGQARRRS
jgi:hypothetical protein